MLKYKNSFKSGRPTKSKCEKCKIIRRVNRLSMFKGKLLCSSCKVKTRLSKSMNCVINRKFPVGRRKYLNEALNKIYKVRGYDYGCPTAVLSLPSVLANRKVKLVLVSSIKLPNRKVC
jgi:ribosomal protein L36